ncbi:polysaccharide pyruvyl transferase family protein [Halomonas alkalisoli]|uniref:polysaccharide pyruvyl transferase family protein n=1 Tax=Halomonas alkalisoli TaxID=2907158 RepID=UPI001F411E35|nr:polysaccharide pyruvyl transferase family protein [Halomonas alkalisoli]MCE9681657.1 polysaccharide pyruvyl transferase family protein [Halomonas alkalisoli]
MKIALFDTSVCTENLGDFIIMDAVRDHINTMFPDAMVLHTSTHDKISKPSYRISKGSDFSFVGGTNLLSSNMNKYNQWKINLFDGFFLDDIVLMGVGWWQYQKSPNQYTRTLLKSVLHKDMLHSVRDSYAEKMLKAAGISNVINTSCPTMWWLDEEHCAGIPAEKGENVVATITDYNKDPKNDLALFEILKRSYQKVYVWPQGSNDLSYIEELGLNRLSKVLPPNLKVYNNLLASEQSLDFVGTRLHAGVRALQHKKRTIIIGIDNRAFEKAKDFNIKVCPRGQMDELKGILNGDFKTDIKLPNVNIARWKNQFV